MLLSPLRHISPISGNRGGVSALTISSIVSKYGFLNAWSAENITINGTTTTLHDYLGEHDLSNPTVASQPTFSGADSSMQNRPTLSFTTDDYLTKAVANWRSADASGVFIAVIRNSTAYFFSTNDNTSNSNWFSLYRSGTYGLVKNGAVVVNSTTNTTAKQVVAMVGTGTEFKAFVNGVNETTTPLTYNWLNSTPTQRDDITMGATTRLSPIYSTSVIAFVGYLPYTNDATIIACQNELKTLYGI
jgi:hypothetical protein